MTQNNLGNALQDQGTRTSGEEGRRLLAQAVAAYRAALEVRTREQLPQDWAMTQNNLGIALQEQGIRTGGEEGRQTADRGSCSLSKVLWKFGRPKSLPPQWAQTHDNLSKAYIALTQWREAAQSLRNVLHESIPSTSETSLTLASFTMTSSSILKPPLLLPGMAQQHPANFRHGRNWRRLLFTVGHFAEAAERISELLADPGLDAALRTALRALEIGALFGQQKAESVPDKLRELTELVSAQPADFRVGWEWAGTLHFIRNDDRLAPVRGWLVSLFTALEGRDRAAIVGGLRAAAEAYSTRETSAQKAVGGQRGMAARGNPLPHGVTGICGVACARRHRIRA